MRERHTYQPTEAEIAWAAGLYEGEGTAIYLKSGRSQWMAIRMTDKEPIERMCRLFGGNFKDAFINPGEVGKGYKPKFMWRVSAWRDIIRVTEAIYPWLSPRRQRQIDAVLVHKPAHPRGELACPPEPIPSVLGMQRHRKNGVPPCDTCRRSWNLYYAERRKRLGKEEIARRNRAQYLKRKALLAKQEGMSSEITN